MKLFSALDRKNLIVAALFVLSMLVYEAFIFNTYRNFIFKSLHLNDNQPATINFYFVFFFGYISAGLLLLVFVYLSMASSRWIKALYFLFFVLTSFYEYTYQRLYGRFSLIQDLSLAFFTTQAQRLDAILSYTSLLALIPCLVYLILLLAFKVNQKFTLKKSLAALAIFLFMLSGFNLVMWLAAPRYYFLRSAEQFLRRRKPDAFRLRFHQSFLFAERTGTC